MKEVFQVTGMTCSACSAHVERAVAKVPGVESCPVNLMLGSMVVTYDETPPTPRPSSPPSLPQATARSGRAKRAADGKPPPTTRPYSACAAVWCGPLYALCPFSTLPWAT